MSDVGRYRKVYARLWRHPGFTSLNEGEKVLALYLLTGPQTNRLGLYCLSVATAAEDLGTVPQTLTKRLRMVCQTFSWLYDGRSRVLYIPSWFRWNPPENVNVVKGSLKDLNEIPPSGLVDAFARNIETLPDTLRETFIEGLRQRLPNGIPNQEQEPYPYPKLEQEPALRALAENDEQPPSTQRGRSEQPAALVAIARETLKLTNPNEPIEELVDAFTNVHLHVKPGAKAPPRDAIVAVLNMVLAERRSVTA